MRTLLAGAALIVLSACPALANQCPTLQAKVDAEFGNRFDGTAAQVRALAHDAWALHEAGKHADSEAKYAEAMKAGQAEMK